MTEVDLAQLMKVAQNPATEKTVSGLDSIMKQMNSIEKIIKNIDSFITVLEKSPSISAAIRIAAKQNDVSLEPLRTEPKIQYVETGLKPASELHEKMFQELNKLSVEQLNMLLQQQKAQNDSVQNQSGKPDNKQPNPA